MVYSLKWMWFKKDKILIFDSWIDSYFRSVFKSNWAEYWTRNNSRFYLGSEWIFARLWEALEKAEIRIVLNLSNLEHLMIVKISPLIDHKKCKLGIWNSFHGQKRSISKEFLHEQKESTLIEKLFSLVSQNQAVLCLCAFFNVVYCTLENLDQ